MSNSIDLDTNGTIYGEKEYKFGFEVFQKPYESFYGETVAV